MAGWPYECECVLKALIIVSEKDLIIADNDDFVEASVCWKPRVYTRRQTTNSKDESDYSERLSAQHKSLSKCRHLSPRKEV